jgi:hypothetical protein
MGSDSILAGLPFARLIMTWKSSLLVRRFGREKHDQAPEEGELEAKAI